MKRNRGPNQFCALIILAKPPTFVIEGLAERQRQTTDSDYGKKDDYILRFLDEDEVARPLQNARAALNTHHISHAIARPSLEYTNYYHIIIDFADEMSVPVPPPPQQHPKPKR